MNNPFKICEGVYIFQSDLWMINSGLILNDLGSVVVDPAYFPEEIMDIAGFIKTKNCKAGYLVFTHSDFDHIVGYQNFPGARKVGSGHFDQCIKKEQLKNLVATDLDYNVQREEFFFPELNVIIEQKMRMSLKKGHLLFFEAPGHTEDSIFTVYDEKEVLFSGDTLSDIEFPFIYYDSSAYRQSLLLARKLVDKYDIKTIVPGHGNVAQGRKQIIDRIENDIAYIDNLKLRTQDLHKQGLSERQIIAGMMEFEYAHETIVGNMVKMHLDNVKQVLSELNNQ